MAGSPKKRQRREAAAARAAGLAPAPTVFVEGGTPGSEQAAARNMMSKEEFLADRRRPFVEYTEELGIEVCSAIAGGLSMTELSSMEGMPSRRSILNWRRKHPEFAEALADALRFRADARLSMIDAVIEDITAGRIDAHSARLIFDAHRWLASREHPGKYSDNAQPQRVELSGKDGGPLVSNLELARFYALIFSRAAAEGSVELGADEYAELPAPGR